jgi:hypothetical protein
VNVTSLDDTKSHSDKEITGRVQARNARVATDDSVATAFLNDGSANDRPVRTPLVAIGSEKAEATHRQIKAEEVDSDNALKVHLGIPERMNGVLLPAERQAIDTLRSTLKEIWQVNPNAKVVQLLSPVAAYSEANAKRMGLDVATAPRDQQGRVLARVRPSVAYTKAGTPEIKLPRGFTLKDVRQAQVQLLATENGAAAVQSDWNQNQRNLMAVVDEWWKRVEGAVRQTAMLDPLPDVDGIEDAGKRLQVLSQKATQLLQVAKVGQQTQDVGVLQAVLDSMQASQELGIDAARSIALRLNGVAQRLTETSEPAKARALIASMKRGKAVAAAQLVARPDMTPESGKPTAEAESMAAILGQQVQGAPWLDKMLAQMTSKAAAVVRQAEAVTEMDKDLADDAAEAVAENAAINQIGDDARQLAQRTAQFILGTWCHV